MKPKFTLSKSNKIFVRIILGWFLLRFIIIIFSGHTPYEIGEFIGKLFAYFLFPLLFAWIAWRLSGRKEKSGSVTFNVVLLLVVLGQIGQFGKRLQESQSVREIQEQKEEFKQTLANVDDLEQVDAAYEKFADSVIEEFAQLSERSRGEEKEFYKIMSGFVSDSRAMFQRWSDSFDAVQAPRILDYSLLNSDEEFDFQKDVLEHYIEETKAYNRHTSNMISDLKKRLSVLGQRSEYAAGAVKGATEKYLLQKPIFDSLFTAHVEYGNNIIQLLELLQKNQDEWSYANDELLIDSDAVLNECNELFEKMSINEATINTLSEKLLEVI